MKFVGYEVLTPDDWIVDVEFRTVVSGSVRKVRRGVSRGVTEETAIRSALWSCYIRDDRDLPRLLSVVARRRSAVWNAEPSSRTRTESAFESMVRRPAGWQ